MTGSKIDASNSFRFGTSRFNLNTVCVESIVVGSGARTGVGLAVPTQANAGQMFIGSPEVRTSYMVFDDAPEGVDEDVKVCNSAAAHRLNIATS